MNAAAKAGPVRLAIFASGQGTNLRNIYQKVQQGQLGGVEIALVVSNNSTSGALQFAKEAGLEWKHLSLVTCDGDEARLSQELGRILEEYHISLIALAGYMRKLPDVVVQKFTNRIVNVHPSLLPSFGGKNMYGLNVHTAVLARGCKVTGATAHLVSNEYDEGPILLQECCPVLDNDTPETLQERVQQIEYAILPKAIELLAQEKIEIRGSRVFLISGSTSL